MADSNTDAGCSHNNLDAKTDQVPEEENVLMSNQVEDSGKHKLLDVADATQACLKVIKSESFCSDSENIATANLPDLNDNCLAEIFKYLTFLEKCRLALTCTRLLDFFVCFKKIHEYSSDAWFGRSMTLPELKDFFSQVGQFITHIDDGIFSLIPGQNIKTFFEFIKYCENATNLDLSTHSIQTENLNELFFGRSMYGIVELRLAYCNLTDDSIIVLRKLQVLKHLDLSSNDSLTGEHIHMLSNTIERLLLENCNHLDVYYMTAFCKSLVNLKELNLIRCFKELPQFNMTDSCKKLELLKLNSGISIFVPFATLSKLKTLVILVESHLTNTISELIEHRPAQLECLVIVGEFDASIAQMISQLYELRKIVCQQNPDLDEQALHYFCNLVNLEEIVLWDCESVDNAALMQLVLGCTKLKRIHLSYCKLISETLFLDLIKEFRAQMQSNTYKRQEPILFSLYNTIEFLKGCEALFQRQTLFPEHTTEIERSILNNPEYKAAKNILRIDFDSTISYDLYGTCIDDDRESENSESDDSDFAEDPDFGKYSE